ncbi:MAG: MerR family transcriptional regulator [Bacteroidetes bacterium]|nr:MAG: MerR family transcriptional regulator [Bacteroidota bacterium]
MNAFTIRDLENLSGIKAHTIRIWEQRYAFLKPERTSTNIRYYSNDELKKLLNISLLNRNGFKISHIDRMSEMEMRENIRSLSHTDAQQERIVNDLIHMMVDLRLNDFEQIIDNHILARGIERSLSQIIFPFLERIGILWQTCHIIPAQEHLVTNIIRQKLIVGIESIVSHVKVNRSVLLFLPESEFHELGLLFAYFLLKSRGTDVIYLGASVPLDDVEYVVRLKKPDYVYTHLSVLPPKFNFDRFLAQVSRKFEGTNVIISGPVTHFYEKKLPPGVSFKQSCHEVFEFAASLH